MSGDDELFSGLCDHEWQPARSGRSTCAKCGLEIEATDEFIKAFLEGRLTPMHDGPAVDPDRFLDELAASVRLAVIVGDNDLVVCPARSEGRRAMTVVPPAAEKLTDPRRLWWVNNTGNGLWWHKIDFLLKAGFTLSFEFRADPGDDELSVDRP